MSNGYGYFGPEGTFTHQALLRVPNLPAELIPYATVPACLDAVRSGAVAAGLVPIENSVEGGVSATLDNLATGTSLTITREVLLPVQFGLYGRPGTTLGQVRRILTHPHAAAQTRDWLAEHLPGVEITEGPSTAGAAAEVADPASAWQAAVCNETAATLYRLELLAGDIADNPDAVTRFVLVTRRGMPPAPTGADKTTLVLFQRDNHAGALREILDQFGSRGVNLSRLESRPTKTTLGSYCFSVDADGHVADARLAEALMGLHRICRDVVFLGSYPRADAGRGADVPRRGTTNADYAEARAWLESLTTPPR